jgi:formylmethanofuran dehydrogenase subunit E-like metal-binding protein
MASSWVSQLVAEEAQQVNNHSHTCLDKMQGIVMDWVLAPAKVR